MKNLCKCLRKIWKIKILEPLGIGINWHDHEKQRKSNLHMRPKWFELIIYEGFCMLLRRQCRSDANADIIAFSLRFVWDYYLRGILHNLQNKSEESMHDRHKWNRFGSTATDKNAIGSAEAMRTQTDLHCYQNSFETMIYEEFCIICQKAFLLCLTINSWPA